MNGGTPTHRPQPADGGARSLVQRTDTRVWLVLLVCWLGLLYLPDVGRGFLKDDFRWIAEGRVASSSDLWRILGGNLGFYRPLVTLTFSVNYALVGLHSYPYAITNFAVLALCVWAIRRLSLALGLDATAATVACGLWALNFHGVSGSLLWISGRTSLLLTLFSVLALTAWVRRRPLSTAVWFTAALLSKEDSVVLPVLMVVWSTLRGRSRSEMMWAVLVGVLPLAAYAYIRKASGAFSYWNAPSYYTPTDSVQTVATNALQYLDRNATFAVAGLVILCIAARTVPVLNRDRGRLVAFGIAWAAICQLPTLFLPARSSLYVLLPSVGVAVTVALLAQTVWERQSVRFRRQLLVSGIIVATALWPIYHSRNLRLMRQAELSAATVRTLEQLGDRAEGRLVVLRDDPAVRDNFATVFGALLPEVHQLVLPQAAGLWIEPPPEGAEYVAPPPTGLPAIEVILRGGQVRCCATADP